MEQNTSLINLTPVDSSTIAAIGHENNTLYVFFHKGTYYRYEDITSQQAESILTAHSAGTKLFEIIKDKLFKKLSEKDPEFKRLKYDR
ncbi:MAG: KTSC domain-containing protein [Bacteroidota bacterium]